MSRYQPPFVITASILNNVVEIGELLGLWAAQSGRVSPLLRKEKDTRRCLLPCSEETTLPDVMRLVIKTGGVGMKPKKGRRQGSGDVLFAQRRKCALFAFPGNQQEHGFGGEDIA